MKKISPCFIIAVKVTIGSPSCDILSHNYNLTYDVLQSSIASCNVAVAVTIAIAVAVTVLISNKHIDSEKDI
jgi:hypothetical protein